MKLIWSEKFKLEDYIKSPKVPGIYIVGVNRLGVMHDGDEYLGKNMPHEFIPRYVGISKKSIRSRLYCHAKCKGNRFIREFIKFEGITSLEYIYCAFEGAEIENQFLTLTQYQFVWNIRKSEQGSWNKFIRNL